ncbi:MAG TPA: CvpA family protein [Methylibium sp.]
MAWVDIALLCILGLSVVLGIARGLVFEVMSLAGWVVAYFAAQWLVPELAPHLPIGSPGSALNAGAAFASGFIAVLIGWGLLCWLIRKLVHASPLSVIDRLLGGFFGLARGLLIGLVAVTLVAYTPLARSADWQASQGVAALQALLAQLKPLLPGEVVIHLPA